MSQPSIVDANWYLALGLTERAASLRTAFDANATAVWDVARAERRMARWRALPPFAAEGSLARRLAAEGLSEDDLHYLLGEPAEALRDRVAGRLPWLDALQQAFARRPP
ncbi:MAG: hypothetical protein IRY97_08940, partial [Thermomicrobiaceae bacterium]|nr:hypothetical protein [Thermomicrobiaceae bacterium]